MEARIAELWAVLSWPILTVWIAAPAIALFWVELLKSQKRRAGAALDSMTLIALDSGLACLLALGAAWGLFDWPIDKAIKHGIGVAVALPLLCTLIFSKVQKLAPDTAESMGFDAVPTQYRIDDDTTEPKP